MGGVFDALGITYDTNRNIGQTAYEKGEDIRLNPWQRFLGVTDDDAENARLKAQQKDLQSRYGAQLAIVGSTGVDWGETEQQVQGKIARLGEERKGGQEAKKFAQEQATIKLGQKVPLAQIAANERTSGASLDLQREQGNQQHLVMMENLASQRDTAAATLEYQKMRDRRSDQEYNERMERLDRKDRQAMMQNLAAGLASLGAAFAL